MSGLHKDWKLQHLNVVEFKQPRRRISKVGWKHGVCACCGAKGIMTKDHIVPRSKGGKNDRSNYQILCSNCNTIKAARLISLEVLRKEVVARSRSRIRAKLQELLDVIEAEK